MADDPSKDGSPKTEPAHVEASEDAETRATRRELKQSSLSDAAPSAVGTTAGTTSDTEQDKATDPNTPQDQDQDLQDEAKEGVLSPKKKRAHDQLDKDQVADDNDATSTTSTDSAKDRASRLEPEKKRHRDHETVGDDSVSFDTPYACHAASAVSLTTKLQEPSSKTDQTSTDESSKPSTTAASQTSTGAFASSGFGKLATGSSPFAALGSPKKTGFASLASPPPLQPSGPPKMTFGGGNSASPFAGLSSTTTNGFGSAFGSGGSTFGSAFDGGQPLSSFAGLGSKPALKSDKPARPFGAPDSDVEEEDNEGDEDDEGGDDASQPEQERLASPEKEPEEKKKLRLQRGKPYLDFRRRHILTSRSTVVVNDGEAGEATIVSVRAKVFHHDKEVGWKERGAGMLKINVPEACLEFDALGVPIPGSFDASGLDSDEDDVEKDSSGSKVARLILRQDQTHRVILNTAIVPAMKFQEKASLKSVGIIFTAFEGEEAKPVNITVKASLRNAKRDILGCVFTNRGVYR